VSGYDEHVDCALTGCGAGKPGRQVRTDTSASEQHVIEVDEVASVGATLLDVEPALRLQGFAEKLPDLRLAVTVLLDVQEVCLAPVIARLVPSERLVRDLLSEELTDRRAREVRLLEHVVEFPKQRNLNLRVELAHPPVDMLGGRRWKITRSVVSGGLGDRLEQRLPFRHGLPPVFF
jgi:hypothetical protein